MNTTVKSKIDVILCKNLDSSLLHILQFPSISNGKKILQTDVTIRNKAGQNKYEFDIKLDTSSANFSKGRAECLSSTSEGGVFEAPRMTNIKMISKAVDDKKQFCMGFFSKGKLYLTPVSSVMQMMPEFHHMDDIEKARRKKANAALKNDESCSSQDESTQKKAQAITVKFGKNESEEAKAKRKQLYHYLKQTWDTEPWTDVDFINAVNNSSLMKKIFTPSNVSSLWSKSKEFPHIKGREYLKSILPAIEISNNPIEMAKTKQPYAPSSELNVENLKNMSLMNKICAILKSASVVRYSQLITLLGNKAEKENVLSCLKKVAVLVRGCWVISSEVVYQTNSVSSACGISAELMRRGRDYILWRMNKHGFVMRKEMCSHTKLPGEEVRSILEVISELNSETGWEFLYPVDNFFLESNRNLRDEYHEYWIERGQMLCSQLGLVFKHDSSPRRHRSRNLSSDSTGPPSPGAASEKGGRKRRNSTRSSLKDEVLGLISDKEIAALKRSHSSGSESTALEKFLSYEELKTMQNRMESYLLIRVADFRAILSRIVNRNLTIVDYGRAAKDLDLFEVSIKGLPASSDSQTITTTTTTNSSTMAYCVCPPDFSHDEKTLLSRCTALFTSKGFITKQTVPKLIHNLDVDKSTLEKVLNQLCLLKDKKWVPKFLGIEETQSCS